MNRTRNKIWPTLIWSTMLLSIGGVSGFFLRPVIIPPVDIAHTDDHHDEEEEGHGANIVEILEGPLANLNIKVGKFERKDYFESIRVPAEIVEQIPQGRRRLTTRFAGRVDKVHITKGQAVPPGGRLFDLTVTDNELSASQVELLNVLANIEANNKQFDRLKPLVDKGIVARKRILDVELESDKLQQQRTALVQGLGIRGLEDAQIKRLISEQEMPKTIGVFAPEIQNEGVTQRPEMPTFSRVSFAGHAKIESEQLFTVESISALEGANLEIGETLCELTHHGKVLIKGMAYETDIRRIAIAREHDWKFSAHFGEGVGSLSRDGLELFQIENHVDGESQTYPVLVNLDNEIVNRYEDPDGRMFVNWRFKPGQRAHLEVPVTKWEKQWVVPLEALAYEGPQAFVFQKINHTHETPEGTVHEFAKTSVKILHKDRFHAVLEKNPMLKHYEEYALDQAYQLNLILKAAASGGGGHHHHDH